MQDAEGPNWTDIVRGAIGIAIAEFYEQSGREAPDRKVHSDLGATVKSNNRASYKLDLSPLDPTEIRDLQNGEVISLNSRILFKEIAIEIDSSVCIIIDVTNDNALAYFWMGYAYGRGVPVIPLQSVVVSKDPQEEGKPLASRLGCSYLSQLFEDEPWKLKDTLKPCLEEILKKETFQQESTRFWSVFGSNKPARIFLGAEIIETISEPVSQSWDLRAASVLSDYLGSMLGKGVIETIPVTSPEDEARRIRVASEGKNSLPDETASGNPALLERYVTDAYSCLRECVAVIIGSAERNAMAEMSLHDLHAARGARVFESEGNLRAPCYVMVKGTHPGCRNLASEPNRRALSPEKGQNGAYPRRFYVRISDLSIETEGYALVSKTNQLFTDDRLVCTSAQSIAGVGNSVLCQIVISNDGALILNSPAGPATLALAQILSGKFVARDARHRQNLLYEREMLYRLLNSYLEPSSLGIEVVLRVDLQIRSSLVSQSEVLIDEWTYPAETWRL